MLKIAAELSRNKVKSEKSFKSVKTVIKIWCTLTSKQYALYHLSLTVHQVSMRFNENFRSYLETKCGWKKSLIKALHHAPPLQLHQASAITLSKIKCVQEAQVGQKSLTWVRLIMICYIVPWWPPWLSDQVAFSNSESDVVWRVSRLPPLPPSWILELKDSAILNLHFTSMPPIKFWLNLTYGLGGDVVWRISRWPWWPFLISERNNFSNSESLCHRDASC